MNGYNHRHHFHHHLYIIDVHSCLDYLHFAFHLNYHDHYARIKHHFLITLYSLIITNPDHQNCCSRYLHPYLIITITHITIVDINITLVTTIITLVRLFIDLIIDNVTTIIIFNLNQLISHNPYSQYRSYRNFTKEKDLRRDSF